MAPIVRALGGGLYDGGRRANIPGPGHSSDDRSVSLWLKGRRVIVHGFAGDDWRDVLADLRDRGLVDQAGCLLGSGSACNEVRLAPGTRRRLAAGLWGEGVAVDATPSARHLAQRGVAAPPDGLRHHPAAPAAIYAASGPRRPALMAAIRGASNGEVVGVEITYLTSGGDRARLALPRKTIGLVPPGAAVRLWPAGSGLLVGEGVFTCLSAAARFGLPAWALLSAGNLPAWRPPEGVRFVLIAGDRGAAGEAAAWRLATRLRDEGRRCAVRFPPAPFGDWNDAALAGVCGGE